MAAELERPTVSTAAPSSTPPAPAVGAGAPDAGAGALAALDLGQDGEDLTGSLEDIAAFFKVSEPTARDWLKAGCPVVEEGGRGRAYKLSYRAVAAWRDDMKARQEAEKRRKREAEDQLRLELYGADGTAMPELPAGLSARETAEELAAEISRTRLAEMRGDLVRAAALEQAIADAIKLFQEGVRRIPDQLIEAFQMPVDQADALLEAIDGELETLADRLERLIPSRAATKAAA